MRVRLKGIHKVTKTLADGTRAVYFYAWRGGPRLDGKPGDADFVASYNRAVEARKQPKPGHLFSLIAEFRASSEYTRLAPRTRASYSLYLRKIENEFGDMPIAALEDRRVRGVFKAWRDTMADTPRTADLCWTVLQRVLSVARDNGRITANPCERGGRLYSGSRADVVWTDADIEMFNRVASPELRLALLAALWTAQRQGDLLAMTWSAYDGRSLTIRQQKTGTRVEVPVAGPLREALEATPRRSTHILTNSDGVPWTSDGFRSSWNKTFKRSGIKTPLHFHDLRGTAISRLATVADVPVIASVTGHSLATINAILQRHYFKRDVDAAREAVAKLEKRVDSVNRSQTGMRSSVET